MCYASRLAQEMREVREQDDDVVVISDSVEDELEAKERAQKRHHAIAVAAASAAHRAELVRQHAVQSSSPPAPGLQHRPLERAQSSPSVTIPLSPGQHAALPPQDVTMKHTFTTGKQRTVDFFLFLLFNLQYHILLLEKS